MRVGILTIGRELLTGRTLDTHSQWLAQRLVPYGFAPIRFVTVDDHPDEIAQAIHWLRSADIEVILTTGGLGPTEDDLTLAAIALALGKPLVLHEEALQWVQTRYRDLFERGLVDSPELTEERKKMAYLPDGARMIPNLVGAAPGALVPTPEGWVIALPGVPREMHPMFEQHVLPFLLETYRERLEPVVTRVFLTGMRDESQIEPHLKELRQLFPMFYFKSKAEHYGGTVDIPLEIMGTKEHWEESGEALARALQQRFPQGRWAHSEDGDGTELSR